MSIPPPAPLNRTALLTLTALFTLLAAVYGMATPPFETPDEPLHFFYAHHLAQGRGLPVLPPRPGDGWGQEGAQPPLAYALLAAPALLAPPGAGPAMLGLPGDALTAAVRAGRLLSALAGAAAVLGAAQLARWTLRDERLALAAAAVMAFTPQFLFLSGAVTNDVLTAALATWVLALTAEALHSGLSQRKVLALGILCGLAPLAKVSGGLAAAVALAALLAPRAGLPLSARARDTVLVGGVALAVCGWWPLRNLMLYGAPLALSEHLSVIGHRPVPPTLMEFLSGGELAALFMSYWGLFGWQSVPLPPLMYLALAAVCGSAGVGLAMLAARRVMAVFRSPAAAALPAGMAALAAAAVWSWNTQVYAAQGRLLFPALAPLSILLVAGLAALIPQGWRVRLTGGVALGLFTLSAAAPVLVIAPRYSLPPLPPVAADAPALVRYGSDLILQSAEI
ncbi:MAG: DUF2142 domain-containing protein, partial [Chloroflexi bacterium]|nr:DUF2142 domain-containing protein [Chloroflexota bacterium]